MEISKKKRQEVEAVIYEAFELADPSGTNTEHYKKLFAKMNDKEFLKFVSSRYPYRYHEKPFVTEPDIDDLSRACDFVGVPLLEKINQPDLYVNKDGIPVNTLECMVVYLPIKKVKQFITKKNAMSVDISKRDMKTGLLTGFDKNGKTSDREMESLAVMGLEDTMLEFGKYKADSMDAKNKMYNTINSTGQVSAKDIPVDEDDSLSKNLLNTYLIGSLLNSNLINKDYYLPLTLKNKKKQIERK